MSDNQDIRPEDGSAADAPQTPDASGDATTPQTPAVAPAAPAASTPAQPAAPAGYPAPAYPPAPTTPASQGYPTGQQAAPAGQYPTQPYPGAGFGVGPAPQTQPVGPESAPARTEKKNSGAGKVVGLLVAAALVGGAAGLGATWAGANLWGPVGASPAAGPSVVTVNNTESVNATTAIATKVLPSVVTISVSSGQNGGTGSGVVLSKDGYILTNTHVVTIDGQTASPSISVTTSDGRIFSAKVVGTDPIYDLAVIKVSGATDLTPITWGDSSKLNVGDETVAIGAPLGLANTVTTGIVSALNRSIEIASSAAPRQGDNTDNGGNGNGNGNGDNGNSPFYFDFGQQPPTQQANESIKIAVIQTDAPINPGNSGGALVDSAGKLVGINVAIASTGSTSSSSQSGSIGVGFSIPSDIAHRVAAELMDGGHATHGLLGATVRDAASMPSATMTGADIVSVTSGGGAAKAGLRAGDVVTSFNGVPVGSAVDLTAQVRAAAAGSTASVTFVRDGQTQTVQATLGSLK
ncbi:hypothetical protein GCM10022240_13050 [Microbacterium kribbense]|uniref:PDZ domain-containing protein n=1 Tax=Microbacterium kribbense TaxID=433645 RepID=A0ABP7GEH9_9MICO